MRSIVFNFPKSTLVNENMPLNTINLDQFREMLQRHDWFYSWSDDHRVWSSGENYSNLIRNLAKNGNDDWKRAYNTEFAKNFHRPPFGEPYRFPFPDISGAITEETDQRTVEEGSSEGAGV